MSVAKLIKSVCVDTELHIKLLYKGSPLTLPLCFHYGQNCCLTRKSVLENLPVYLQLQTEQLLFS